jgi:6-phosphogluconolactonase (cycloisomerase 2 family)
MALLITNRDNVTDDATLELDGVWGATTAVVSGNTYLFAAGNADYGVSVFSVSAAGTLRNVANVSDDATRALAGAIAATTTVVGGATYLFVAGYVNDGVSVFSVAPDGALTDVRTVTDGGQLELDGPAGVTTAVVGGTTYLFVAGNNDDGVSVFSVGAGATLTNVDNVSDGGELELDGAAGVTTAVVGGTTYLFVTSFDDDGVSVFSVGAGGTLTNVDNVTDSGELELDGTLGATTAAVGGVTYLFVPGQDDDGVSVFSVGADGTLTNVDNVSDDATLALAGASDVRTVVIGGTTYLFVTGAFDDGVSVFSVGAGGTLTHVTDISDDATLELNETYGATTAVVGGTPYLFVTGFSDDGASVFSLVDENPPPLGDVLWRHSDGSIATADQALGAVPDTWRIASTGDFDGDGDADILWRHQAGAVVTWEMQNGQYVRNHNIASASTGWEIVNAGDFDADGDADILWRHQDGAVVTWEMEDGQYVQNHNIALASNTWRIDGVGDFDSDGDADIVWRHQDGAVVTWEMEGGAYVTNHNIASASTGWQVQGTGDFDADGDSDILWRHDGGDVVTWEMENGAYLQNHALAGAATTWQIAGTHDFDGDNDADILWRHQQGTVVSWNLEDGALAQTQNVGAVSSAWQIRGTGAFDLA